VYGVVVLADGEVAPPKAKMVLTEAEALENVTAWREAHPMTTQFWRELEHQAIEAVRKPGRATMTSNGKIAYQCGPGTSRDFLRCRLPSGRLIAYPRPKLRTAARLSDDKGKRVVQYIGGEGLTADEARTIFEEQAIKGRDGNDIGSPKHVLALQMLAALETGEVRAKTVIEHVVSLGGGIGRRVVYGGLLAENVTQAAARDCLADAMLATEGAGYPVVLHVHDEIVAEVPEGVGDLGEFKRLMAGASTYWARDLPVAVEGWRGKRYRK
jgi:DNA polymerase